MLADGLDLLLTSLAERLRQPAAGHGRVLKGWRGGGARDSGGTADEDGVTVIFGVTLELPWLMSHYMWPFIFSVVFMSALLSGITIARARAAQGRRPVYFHPLAVSEALVSITAGVLLWMGVWDLLDEYLVPEEWWAKLFMLAAGGFALFSTRTLYDETHVISSSGKQGAYSSVDTDGSAADQHDSAGETGGGCCCCCCGRGGAGVSNAEAEVEMEPPSDLDVESAGERVAPDVPPTPWTMRRGAAAAPAASPEPRRYFHRPAFSVVRCSRALFAIFAGLVLWVGLWDLVDEHILPTVFSGCQGEPSGECAMVKLGLVGVRVYINIEVSIYQG